MNEFARFLGHLHPMLVHLPVGGLVVLGVLEALALSARFKDMARNRRLILAVVALGAILAAACGWLLAAGGGYDAELLSLHRWLGLGVAAACVGDLADLFGRPAARVSYRAFDYARRADLCRAFRQRDNAWPRLLEPPRLCALGARAPAQPLPALPPTPRRRMRHPFMPSSSSPCCNAVAYPAMARRNRRVTCAWTASRICATAARTAPSSCLARPDESLMIRRLLLPLEDDDHMPPDGKPQPTAAEIALLQLWINAGAPELSPPSSTNAAQVTGTHAKTSTGVKETRP